MFFFGTSEPPWLCSYFPEQSPSEDSTFCAMRIVDIVTFYLSYTLAFLLTFCHLVLTVCIDLYSLIYFRIYLFSLKLI